MSKMVVKDMPLWAEEMHWGGWRASDKKAFQRYYEWDDGTAEEAARLLMRIEREKAKKSPPA